MAVPVLLAPESLHATLGGRAVGGRSASADRRAGGQATGVVLRPLPRADGRRGDPYQLRDRLPGVLAEVAGDGHVVDRVVLVVPRRRGAAGAVPGPVLDIGDRLVPVGVLPADRPADLSAWCAARARRASAADGADADGACAGTSLGDGPSRAGEAGGGPVVAAMGTDRFLEPAGRWLAALAAAGLVPADRRASCTRREEFAEVLASGPDLVLYLGHGHHLGWSGYQGLRWQHLPPQRRPIGVVVPLACATLAQPRGQRGFGVRLVVEGRALACLGAVRPLPIADLVALGDALVAGMAAAGDVVAAGGVAAAGGRTGCTEVRGVVPTAPTIASALVAVAAAVGGDGPSAGVGAGAPSNPAGLARALRSLRVVGDPGTRLISPRSTALSCG